MYQIGAPAHLSWTFTDDNGDPVTPDTVTVKITQPDGTTLSTPVAAAGVGEFDYDFTPTQTGLHSYYFAGTGANAANSPVDVFIVDGLTSPGLVSLADMKAQLRKSSDADDAELLGYIRSATGIVHKRCGYSAPTTFTETVESHYDSSGNHVIVVGRTPVLSVTSITPQIPGFAVIDPATLLIDKDAGILYLTNWYDFAAPATAGFYGPAIIVYTAGRSFIPHEHRLACQLIVKWLWDTRRAGATAVPNQGGNDTVVVDGLEIPARAALLMDMSPYTATPGFA